MAIVTFVTSDCLGLHPGYGVTLNVFGSDMDFTRLVVFNSFGVKVAHDIITPNPSPIFFEVGLSTGSPGFTNGNYSIGFLPYETEVYIATVACPLPRYDGIFILNQDISRRDLYLESQNKIPDPTIRTALLGE